MPALVRILAATLLLSLTLPANAQTNDAWLNELPSIAEVEGAIVYGDEVETIARRQVMFETLNWAMENHMGRRYYAGQMTERERRTLVAYGDAEHEASVDFLARASQEGRRAEAWDTLASARMRARRDSEWLFGTFQSLAPSLYASQSRALEAHLSEIIPWYNNLVTGDTLNLTIVAAWGLAGLSFLILLVGSIRDRFRKEGVVVRHEHDHMLIKYWPGKFSPITALSTYPLMFNIALFSITIGFPLAIALTYSDGLWEWLDANVPYPEFLDILLHREFWIWLGLAVLLWPWWIAAFANMRRKPKTIRADASGFTVGRKILKPEEIESVYGIGLDEDENPVRGNYYVPMGATAASRAAEAGRMHREAIAEARDLVRRKVGKVRYKVCLQHDGKQQVLASKLPRDRAELVLMAVLHAGEVYFGWELDFDDGGAVSTVAAT